MPLKQQGHYRLILWLCNNDKEGDNIMPSSIIDNVLALNGLNNTDLAQRLPHKLKNHSLKRDANTAFTLDNDPSQSKAEKQAAAKKAAQEYESIFISHFLNSYTKEVGNEENQILGGGQGAQLYKSLLNDEYGKAIANQGGFGIADAIYSQLIEAQQRIDNKGDNRHDGTAIPLNNRQDKRDQ